MIDPNNLEGDPPILEERAAMARELDRVAPTPGDKLALMFGAEADRAVGRAFDTWLNDPSGNSATANLRNELCLVISQREDLKRELAESEQARRVLADAADHLNRRLAELQGELAEERAGNAHLHGAAAYLTGRLRDLTVEKDNAESDRKQAEADTLRALHERNEAREQRNRLVDALAACEAALTAEGGWTSVVNFARETLTSLNPHSASTSPSTADGDPPPPCPV